MTLNNEFPLISGHLSLDFVNTELVKRGVRHDLLVTEYDLSAWLSVMNEQRNVPEELAGEVKISQKGFQQIKELRGLLRKAFEEMADGKQPDDSWVSALEYVIKQAPLSFHYHSGRLIPVPVGSPDASLMSLIAFDALRLLAAGELASMHRCANPGCVLLYIDHTGRRKWCSMKICGNRTKVARNQARRGKK